MSLFIWIKEGIHMNSKQIEEFKRNNCDKCTKDVDCKITQDIDGELVCTEE